MPSFVAEVWSSLTTRPENVARFVHESVELRCGSNTTIEQADDLVPVNWEFSGEINCIYCIGTLAYKYIGRFSVNIWVVGEYTLRVENVTRNDSSGVGSDKTSIELIVAGENCENVERT